MAEQSAGSRGPRTYTMDGHAEFDNVVHYIEKITYDIWNRKLVGLIDRYYLPSTVIHTNSGDICGADAVVASTVSRLAAFPDFHGIIENTVWTGDDQDGYRTSMRWVWTGRNTGHSMYGPPSGRQVRVRAIANCIVKGHAITEEWLVTDELLLLRQLGLNPQHVVTEHCRSGESSTPRQMLARTHSVVHAPVGRSSAFDVEDFVRTTLEEVWNRRMFGRIVDRYAPSYVCHTVGGRDLHGTSELTHDVLVHAAAFPDGVLDVEELYWLDDGNGRQRTALRWTLAGTHEGHGPWGKPTGREVRIMGITQHTIEHGRFVEGWTGYGAVDLLRQLAIDGAAPERDISESAGCSGCVREEPV